MLSRAHFTLSSVSLSNTVRCLWFFMLSQSGFSTKQVDDDDANVKLKPHFGTSGSIPKTSIIRTFLITIICPQYQRFVNINQFLCQFRAFFAECLGKKWWFIYCSSNQPNFFDIGKMFLEMWKTYEISIVEHFREKL